MSVAHERHEGGLVRHPSYYGDMPSPHYFVPQPSCIGGPFVVISPVNGRLADLYDLWNLLTMEPEFGRCSIVFSGNYLCGPQARDIISFLCSLRLSHPSPIFLSGPSDLAAAAHLGLLSNLELTLALTAVGAAWADTHPDVFGSYGISSRKPSELVQAMPPEHREFLSRLMVSIEHPALTLTAMPPSTLSASALTSTFASDFFTLPHPRLSERPAAVQSTGGSQAASLADEQPQQQQDFMPPAQREMTDEQKGARQKTMFVDQNLQFPAFTPDGIAINGNGPLAALFHPTGHVVCAHGRE